MTRLGQNDGGPAREPHVSSRRIPGVGGRLISGSFAGEPLRELSGIHEAPADVARAVARWNGTREAALGPASTARAVADTAVVPLLRLLGFEVSARFDADGRCRMTAASGQAVVPVLVVPWSEPLDAAWRAAVTGGIASDARWCVCTNGRTLRLIDAHRTWARRHLDVDLPTAAQGPDTLRVLWTLLGAGAFAGPDPLLDRVVERSARHGVELCRALGNGVLEALRTVVQALDAGRPRPAPALPALLEQSLTVLYRVLFLLFAEARGLVPVWHPVYRDRYTIDGIVSALLSGRRCRGVWAALQAIARLAHAGCRAGDLRVTPFNGRLFSPLHTPAAERGRVPDEAIALAVLAVGTTRHGGTGRARISYRDLDVEQLGAVYEHVLDYEPAREAGGIALVRTGDVRKASGTFYTPRAVTACLVRRTLAPLVRGRTAQDILGLRIVDPAMGSGAFLVAACRYLGRAAEDALVRDGEWHAAEVTAADRAMLRREVAQRCLYGVDLNPTAVQLARLSLWLATLAGDRPLTFLDHHLAAGDSLTGASFTDLLLRPPGRGSRRRPPASLPLFAADPAGPLRDAAAARVRLALDPDEDVQGVRRKEAALAAVRAGDLGRWRALLDLWCACWFWDEGPPPTAAIFHELAAAVLGSRSGLPNHTVREWQQRAEAVAGRRRFLHWEAEFPEIFFDDEGRRRAGGGFDAVVGNPPWDMVRGDSGGEALRAGRRADARHLVDFARGSGIYAADARSHVNRYQLFVERALQLARPGGRVGLVLPAGLATDAGCAPLRRLLFDRAQVDAILGLDNRSGIFPIHRSVRFVLLTATTGAATDRIACRFSIADPSLLDAVDDHGHDPAAFPVTLSRPFLARVSGADDLAIPEVASPLDLRIVERTSSAHPWLSSRDGWHARFGRELNASDDRAAFAPATGARTARPVLEGKQVSPFRVAIGESTLELKPSAAFHARLPRRARLAYRDVASATNRLTLIAAIVPARAVTTHTLFCLRTPIAGERQLVLCALLNSFVANYLVRLRVNTHVTAAIMSRLPVPWIPEGGAAEERLLWLARRLSDGPQAVEEMDEYAELQGVVGRLYGLTREEFGHVVGRFPLIPQEIREAALARFTALA